MQTAQALTRALLLSADVLGSTTPNPPVGAVVLSADGTVVGEGATAAPGGAHAEVTALAAAGERARGATLVVTLEPCRHTGRTPPCTAAILAAGVRRVVIGVPDPTDLAGGGAAELRAAGVDVELLDDEGTAQGPLEAWLFAQRAGRPFVTWKYAATLDGRVAAADGTSRWITGAQARADVHRLRAESDAIVVGVGTVLADDPELTVRGERGARRQDPPLRVVLDRHGRTPATARVRDDSAPTWITAEDPAAVLAQLHDRGLVSVLLEGGPTVAAGFVRAGLVDRVIGYVAPSLLGAGPGLLGDVGRGTITDTLRLRLDEVVRLGDDVRLTLRSR